MDAQGASALKVTKTILAIDIGGSKFVIGYVDPLGTILCQEVCPWEGDSRSPEMVVEQVGVQVDGLRGRHPEWAGLAVAAGMTLPGFADPITGIWVESDFMGAYDYPIADRMSERVGLPVFVDNDCKACALAERLFGAGRDCDDYLYMTVSNGIGGSIYIHGLPYGGAFGHAGELGLFVMEEGGRASETDCSGVLEMYASGRGFHKTYVESGGAERDSEDQVTGGAHVAAQAEMGEQAAITAFSKQGHYLGRALATALSLLDPNRVIVGGGLSMIYERYRYQLLATLRRCNPAYATHPIPIEPTTLGYFGAFLGATALALRGMGLCEQAPDPAIERDDGLIVDVGKDVRSTIVVRGKPHVGVHGHGGDLGRVIVDDDSTLTLAEAVCTTALLVGWRELGGTPPSNVSTTDIVVAANDGDEMARQVLATAGRHLGRAIALECVLMDPRYVRITGELAAGRAWVEPSCLEVIRQETYYRGNLPFTVSFE